MSRSISCGWKVGARTACPVLIDNLSENELDFIWGEISRINWNLRTEVEPMVPSQIPNKGIQSCKRRSRSRQEAQRQEAQRQEAQRQEAEKIST